MTVPTINELFTSIQSDLRNKLNITNVFGRLVINAFALVQAAKLKIYYLRLSFIYKNILPDTADPEELEGTLQRYGRLKLGRDLLPAVAGIYTVQVTGSIGAVIPPLATFKSTDTSKSPDKLFICDSGLTLTGSTGSISLRALDLGITAKLEIGDELQVTQPIIDLDSFCEVTAIVTEPTNSEDIEEYRQRVIEAYQQESQGGAKTDFRIWAADVQTVRKVYPYVNAPGIIDLYVEANPADSTDGNGTPSAQTLLDVESVVEFDPDTSKPVNERGRRPIGVFQINFLAVDPIPVDVEITDLSDNSYLTAIEDAVSAYLFNVRPFVDGADNPNNSQIDLLYKSDIYGIVRDVIGSNATFTSLTVEVDGIGVDIHEFTVDEIPYLNSVTNV